MLSHCKTCLLSAHQAPSSRDVHYHSPEPIIEGGSRVYCFLISRSQRHVTCQLTRSAAIERAPLRAHDCLTDRLPRAA